MEINIKNLYIPEIDQKISVSFNNSLTFLKGSNESGKTLLLDYIAKLKNPSKHLNNEFTISGNDNLIYLNQNMYYHGRLKVKEYIKFLYNLSGIKNYRKYFLSFVSTHSQKLSDTVIKMMNKEMEQLSGGERRLIYNLIILSIDRQWYILDEPLVGIDTDTIKIIVEIINELVENDKKFIITTHEDISAFSKIDSKKTDVFNINDKTH